VADGLVIPKQVSLEKIMSDLNDTISELSGSLPDKDKTQKKRDELERKANNKAIQYYERQKEFQEEMKDDKVYQYLKRIFPEQYETKLNKYYEKHLIKNKYFQFSMKTMMGIEEAVKNNDGWLMSLIGFLSMLAIFDPNGSFISSVITAISDGIVWLINLIVPLIPTMINTMFSLIPIIVDRLASIIPVILKSLSKALFASGEKAGGFIGQVLKLLSWIAGNQAIITVLESIVKALKYIIPAFLVIAGLAKVFGFISSAVAPMIKLFGVLQTVFSGLVTVAGFLGISVGWLVLIIVGVIAAIYLLVKHWDKVSAFLQNIGKAIGAFFTDTLPNAFFSGMEKFMKWMSGLDDAIDNALSFVWNTIYDIGKALLTWYFVTIPGYVWKGIKFIGKILWDFYTKTIPDFFITSFGIIYNFVSDWITSITKFLKRGFVNLTNIIKGFIPKVLNFFSVDNIVNVMKTGWRSFTSFIDDIWKVIKSPFARLADYIKGFLIYIGQFINDPRKLFGGGMSFAQSQGMAKLSAQTGLSASRLEELSKSKGALKVSQAEIQQMQAKGIDTTELAQLLSTVNTGKDDEIIKVLNKQLSYMQPTDISGSVDIRGLKEVL